jgi:hypothetical protein
VFAVDAPEGSNLLVVHIPPQPEELKPFLVHGAIVGGKVEGALSQSCADGMSILCQSLLQQSMGRSRPVGRCCDAGNCRIQGNTMALKPITFSPTP